jgi:hypothetical protein
MIFAMSNVVRPSFPAASNEMAERLIKAGYLQPALRHDPKAIFDSNRTDEAGLKEPGKRR